MHFLTLYACSSTDTLRISSCITSTTLVSLAATAETCTADFTGLVVGTYLVKEGIWLVLQKDTSHIVSFTTMGSSGFLSTEGGFTKRVPKLLGLGSGMLESVFLGALFSKVDVGVGFSLDTLGMLD